MLEVRYHQILLSFCGEYADRMHPVIFDSDKKLMEQDLLDESKIILSIIYRDFICEEDRRKELLKLQQKYMELESKKNRNVFESKEEMKIEEKPKLIKKKKWYEVIKDKVKVIVRAFKGR